MFNKTQGLAFVTGLLVLSGAGMGSALAFQPGDVEAAFPAENRLSEKLKIKLSVKFRKRGKTTRDRGALAAFYSERDYQPVWITDGQLNSRARKTMDELENASVYGLNPADYTLPILSEDAGISEQATAELVMSQAALTYMRHANGERFNQGELSRFLDRKAKPIDATAKLNGLSNAADPAAYLVALHPHHPQFKALMAALAKSKTTTKEPGERIRIPRGPVLKYGMKHAHIALIRRRLGVPVIDQVIDEKVYDAKLQTAIMAFQKSAGLKAEGIIGLKTRFALNKPKQNRYKQIIANMERWRWMPRDFGKTNIRVNIPEYKVRVTQNGKLIHTERVIVGKPVNKTPVFSDVMETVVFNPYWNVPQSIIWNEMHGRIPSGYEGGVRNGRMWIRQKPGPRNALGRIKFLFPNKHAVYMHDTPSKSLFNKNRRAFSHGCMRVRNPQRLAEVVLGMSGWTSAKVSRTWATRGNKQIALKTKIPVHITYFTLWADENGNLTSFNDVYGHDNRIYAAVTKGVAYAKSRFPEVRKKKIEPRIAALDTYERESSFQNWWFPSGNSNSYWNGQSTRSQKRQRVRIYRKRQRRKQVAFDDFFSLF
jgi:murein L,D-transpeptidase YcbB/YkuD